MTTEHPSLVETVSCWEIRQVVEKRREYAPVPHGKALEYPIYNTALKGYKVGSKHNYRTTYVGRVEGRNASVAGQGRIFGLAVPAICRLNHTRATSQQVTAESFLITLFCSSYVHSFKLLLKLFKSRTRC